MNINRYKTIIIILTTSIFFNLPISSIHHHDTVTIESKLNEMQQDSSFVYAVIVDAGSTGSRALVFKFQQTSSGELDLLESEKFETIPGLSGYSKNPKEAANSIEELLSKAKSRVKQEYWAKTKLQLKATAGLRNLGKQKSEEILDKLKELFKKSDFDTKVNPVEIMTGVDEGVYSWFTVNILQKHILSGNLNETAAVIDLGGSSVEISYNSTSPNYTETYIRRYKIMDININLYSKSFSNLGLISSRESTYTIVKENQDLNEYYVTSPCLHSVAENVKYTFGPKTFYASGEKNHLEVNYNECKRKIETYVSNNLKADQHTDLNAQKIVAISFFFDRAKDQKLVDEPGGFITVGSFYDAAQTECKEGRTFMCMDLLYIAVLLEKGFKLPRSTNINLLNTINGHEISWAFGAAYHLLKPQDIKMADNNARVPEVTMS